MWLWQLGVDEISTIIAFLAFVATLAATWASWRQRELRREEVAAWVNRSIEVMQSTVLACMLDDEQLDEPARRSLVQDNIVASSVLVEQGRMFFKNVVKDGYGAHKHEAYRGYRPRILDHLVVCYEVAVAWRSANTAKRKAMGILLLDCQKQFVSTARNEVGRQKTAYDGAAVHGQDINLELMLERHGRPVPELQWG